MLTREGVPGRCNSMNRVKKYRSRTWCVEMMETEDGGRNMNFETDDINRYKTGI